MSKSTAAVSAADTMAAARATLRADLDSLRDRVSDLQAERQSVANAPCDREEAEARITGLINGARSAGLFDRPRLFTPNGGELGFYFTQALAAKPFEALATLCPDALKAAFLASHPGDGLSTDKRTAHLEELDQALHAAEVAEETAIREFEDATGASLPRRLDANPAIVLAPDNELWRTT